MGGAKSLTANAIKEKELCGSIFNRDCGIPYQFAMTKNVSPRVSVVKLLSNGDGRKLQKQ